MTLKELSEKLKELSEVQETLKQSIQTLQRMLNPKFGEAYSIPSKLDIQLQEERVNSLENKLETLTNINISSSEK
jgi:hypothetical protein